MQQIYSASDWFTGRLKNYCQKLQISKAKALKRLMLFTNTERLNREFDRIVDKQFWSSNEPGISHQERKRREKEMYKQPEIEPIQLSLFNNQNKNQNGNFNQSHRLHKRFPFLFRRSGSTYS